MNEKTRVSAAFQGPARPGARHVAGHCAGIALLLVLVSVPAAAAVKAWLDTNQVAPGSSVQLTLEYQGETNSGPDLTPLERSFDVLGTSRATTVQILNGSTSAKTQVMVTLSPKHAGQLTVPSISWNGERSPPLSLDVTAAAKGAPGAAAGGQKVFLQTQFSPSHPYVQAAVKVTVRLYTREPLYDPDITLAANRNVVVRQIGSDQQGMLTRSGESYEVVTRHYVVFAQRSGRLTLAGPVLDARVAVHPSSSANNPFAGFFGSSFFGSAFPTVRPIRLRGKALHLDVRRRPASAVASYWVPASAVTLKGAWHPSSLRIQAGNPATLDLRIAATGLTAAQLPDLLHLITLPAALKAYPDAPKLSNAPHGDTVIGTREQSVAFIADRPGHYTLPALTVHWWDTQTNQGRVTTLPARTLIVTPAPGSSAVPTSASASAAPTPAAAGAGVSPARVPAASRSSRAVAGVPAPRREPWLARHLPWIAALVGLLLIWVGTFIAWLRLRGRLARRREPVRASPSKREPSGPTAAAARAAFRAACDANQPTTARRNLLAWAAACWLGEAPRGLNSFARQVEDPTLAMLIRDLDRACFSGEPWSGQALGAALRELPRRARVTKRARADDLESLYP